jgi:hypothetical protein
MELKKLIVVGVAAACFGVVAYAAAPTSRPTAPVSRAVTSRAVTLRTQYDPFLLQRQVVAQTRGATLQRVLAAQVRPPYRPPTRSPYQPPARGPYL